MSLKTRRLTLRVPEDLWTRLHYRAEVEGLPFSAILRRDVSQANARWRPPAPSTSGLSLTWDTNAHHKRGEDTMNRELSVSSHDDPHEPDPHEPDHNSDEAARRAPRDTAPRDQEPDEPAEDDADFVDEHTAWLYEGEPSMVLEMLPPAVEPEPTYDLERLKDELRIESATKAALQVRLAQAEQEREWQYDQAVEATQRALLAEQELNDLKAERRNEGPPDEAAETVHKQEVLARWAEADAVARNADAEEAPKRKFGTP